MSQRLLFWPFRVAIWDRLTQHEATTDYDLRRDGQDAALPHLDLGPIYLGERGADTERGAGYVLQVDAWADARDGGAKVVGEMIDGVTTALSDGIITFNHDGVDYQAQFERIEAAVATPDYDEHGARPLYHQYGRYRFLLFS